MKIVKLEDNLNVLIPLLTIDRFKYKISIKLLFE